MYIKQFQIVIQLAYFTYLNIVTRVVGHEQKWCLDL